MRFLADESINMAIVHALRQAGHDVIAIAEECPGVEDEYVANLARSDERVLLTQDRDFGRLVFALGQPAAGVIYLRFNAQAREAFSGEVVSVIQQEGARLPNAFTVIQPGRTRIGRLPPS